ncbi:MAG TPA: glycosyltransferase family 4 protein [Sphingomicrobium sp.]
MPTRGRIILAANSAWNIANFRGGLVQALAANGYDPVVVAPADADSVEQRLAELPIERVPVRVQRSGLNVLADFRLLLSYRRILKQTQAAAFLGFTIKPNIYGCLAARSLGIPALANISGLGTVFIKPGPLLLLVTRLYRAAFRRAAVVFFQNPDDRSLFVERRIVRAEQAALLPGSGIDLERFTPVPMPSGPLTFLLIARVLADKGVREFVEAARLLRPSLPDARFQLLGPIDHENRTAIPLAEVQSWVDEGTIEYLGETGDVRPFIEKASAVVLPSYREGLPRSLLEGAAMGRPLVATDVPGCREVVAEGVNGFLCAARDAGSLAEAMRRFADLRVEQQRAMGAAARAKVQDRFNEEFVVRAYLDALAGLDTVRH